VIELEIFLTLVLVGGGGGAALIWFTRPLWTALWKRYQKEQAEEHEWRTLSNEQKVLRQKAKEELESELHATDAGAALPEEARQATLITTAMTEAPKEEQACQEHA
jgi:cell division protein FtsB